jgi:hypothetical protein
MRENVLLLAIFQRIFEVLSIFAIRQDFKRYVPLPLP